MPAKRTRLTQRQLAEQIGCDAWTVGRALRRLKIDNSQGLTAAEVKRLAADITPGGRGHWPAGKRRNPDRGDWGRIRLTLARFLDDHFWHGVISRCALAKAIGVSERSVRRWLAGDDRPAADKQQAIEQWMIERREQLQR